jgi:EAL domain-containing protein (putative c-di-GMP-specific phosphodiesterase class I)
MERLDFETGLRQAAERGELVLQYRPVVSLATGEPRAFEVELGWQHPRRGFLEAPEFLPVAEETGIIRELGRWALEQSCRDAHAWQAARHGTVVQVDLSPRQLEQLELVEVVRGALEAAPLAPECLRLEVRESAVTQDDRSSARVLAALRQLGVRLALDDVGAGLSSLASLSRLPVDVLKIASSAVTLPGVVRATVALASALGMSVTVQGLEHEEQASRFAAFGCTHAEGPLYGAAMSTHSVQELLAHRSIGRRVARDTAAELGSRHATPPRRPCQVA